MSVKQRLNENLPSSWQSRIINPHVKSPGAAQTARGTAHTQEVYAIERF